MPAYTLTSSSHDIAAAVMAEAAARGHASLDCHYQNKVMDFLDQHASAATLGGWIDCADEYEDQNSYFIMAFIWCHKYLRAWFPQAVLDEFERLAVRNPIAKDLMLYVVGDKDVMDSDREEALVRVSPLSDDARQYVFGIHEHWSTLPEEFD